MRQYAMKQALDDYMRQLTAPNASEAEVLSLYGTVHTVFAICNIRGRNVASVDFEVYDPTSDKVLDTHPLMPLFSRTSNFYDALHRAETTLSIVGKTLLLPNPNTFGMFTEFSDNLLWVKPRAYTVEEGWDGTLEGFRIDTGFTAQHNLPRRLIPADEAIFFRLIDLNDENDGVSPAEAAFNAAGTQREIFATQFGYFLNRMLEAVFLQPAPDPSRSESITRAAAERVQKLINRFGRGSRNAGMTQVLENRWELLNAQGDFAKLAMRELSANTRDALCEAYEMPPEILTFQASNYAQSREAVRFWREHWLVPRVEWYANGLSLFFTRWYGVPVYIRPNFKRILPEDADAKIDRATKKRNGTFIDLYDAALEAGVEKPDEALRGLYVVDGVPVPKTVLPTYYQTVHSAAKSLPSVSTSPAPLLPAANNGTPVTAEKDADATNAVGESIYVVLSLANDPDLIGLQRRVKTLVNDPAGQWNDPASFHVTLAGAPAVSEEQKALLLENMRAIVLPDMALKIGSLKTFDSLGEYAVHFRIRRNQALLDLQHEVYEAFTDAGIAVNSFSQPLAYIPHVTMGYCQMRPSAVTFDNRITVRPTALIVSDDEHQPLLTLTTDGALEAEDDDDAAEGLGAFKAVYIPDDAYKELEVCVRKAMKASPFAPDHLPDATALHIQALAEFARDIGATYIDREYLLDAGKRHYGRTLTASKSAQSTRLDFELQLEDLFTGAVAGTVKRDAFKRKLMQAIRGYGNLLYLDGMRAAGVDGLDITDLEESERAELEAHMTAQREYVDNVANAIYADERVTPEEAANNKPGMWSNKSLMPLYYMGFNAASKNAVMEWVLGNTDEHCPSCKALSGQRRRMSFWKATVLPQSDGLACNGFNCKCTLVVSDRGLSRGRLPRWQFAGKHEHEHREYHVHVGVDSPITALDDGGANVS